MAVLNNVDVYKYWLYLAECSASQGWCRWIMFFCKWPNRWCDQV